MILEIFFLGGAYICLLASSEMSGFVYNGAGKGSYKTVYEYDNLDETCDI
jgi:hypothetical protein